MRPMTKRALKRLGNLLDEAGISAREMSYRRDVRGAWDEDGIQRSSFHTASFAQDYVDEEGRLVHAEWDYDGELWNLSDATTGEPIGVHTDRQLPEPMTFRPPGGSLEDDEHNRQLLSKMEELSLRARSSGG